MVDNRPPRVAGTRLLAVSGSQARHNEELPAYKFGPNVPTETLPYSAAATKGQYRRLRMGAHDPWHTLALALGGAATGHGQRICKEIGGVSDTEQHSLGIDPGERRSVS